jgi:hypothetical protein
MSAIRISVSGGVRHRSSRVVSGDTTITQRAKSTYEGTIATLNNTNRAIGADAVTETSQYQISTTGAADTPHTRVWTVTSDATVQAMRQATTGRDGTIRELTGITGFPHA